MRNLIDTATRPGPLARTAVMAWDTGPATHAPEARCVSLPFTAPTLTAMRVRATQGGGLEMLLSNPAGGRGIYVACWATLRAFAAPSLHDILLADRVAAQSASGIGNAPLSPGSVRAAAIAVAVEGHAGRRVAAAAQRAQQAEQLGRRRLRAHLLLELARALGLPGSLSAMNDPWTAYPDDSSGWLVEAPSLLARLLNRPGGPRPLDHVSGVRPQQVAAAWLPAELDAAIARIAALAWPLGIGPAASQARLPRVLRLLSSRARPEASTAQPKGAAAAEVTAGSDKLDTVIALRSAQATAALHQARGVFEDPLGLLSSWRMDNATLLHTLEQPDWLLDGWDRLCLLPGDAVEVGALAQMLLYHATVGQEAAGEDDRRIGARGAAPDWATPPGISGAVFAIERLARNEAMRLRELQLHDPDRPEVTKFDV